MKLNHNCMILVLVGKSMISNLSIDAIKNASHLISISSPDIINEKVIELLVKLVGRLEASLIGLVITKIIPNLWRGCVYL